MTIQIDNGDFTRIHNTIFEKLALARFTASEYRCLMFLFRATYGWQKKEDAISLSQWATGTGMGDKRHNALRTLQGLVAKRVIYCKPNGNNHAATWGFNKHFDEWDASLFSETVISTDNSSVMSDDNSFAPTVIQPDNSTVISRDNKTVISPDNHKRKKEILKKEGESARTRKVVQYKSPHVDPRHFANGFVAAGTGTSAVEVYYERFSINQDAARLNAIKEDDLVANCKDLDKLREVVTAYSRTSYLPGNVQLILDWYKDGIPAKNKSPGPNGYKNSALSEEEKANLRTRARLARQSMDTAIKFKGTIDPSWQADIDKAKEYGL